MLAGDALDRLPGLVRDVSPAVPVCVYHTLFLYQLPEDDRERLRDQLCRLGSDRELHWVSSAGDVADERALRLKHGVVRDGGLETERLGAFEQHGRWVRWDAPG